MCLDDGSPPGAGSVPLVIHVVKTCHGSQNYKKKKKKLGGKMFVDNCNAHFVNCIQIDGFYETLIKGKKEVG